GSHGGFMRRCATTLIALLLLCCGVAQAETFPTPSTFRFEPNLGQTDGSVRFLARGSGFEVALQPSGVVMAFARRDAAPDRVSIELAGARTDARLEGEGRLGGTSNYFIGNDPSRWVTEVPHYRGV